MCRKRRGPQSARRAAAQAKKPCKRMRQAGKSRQRFGRDKFRFAAQVASRRSRSSDSRCRSAPLFPEACLGFELRRQEWLRGIGNSQAAVPRGREIRSVHRDISAHKAADNLRHFFRAGAPVVSQTTMRLTFWRAHCSVSWVQVVQALPLEIRVAWIAVFARPHARPWRVPGSNNHFEAAVLQARDGLVRHAQVLFRRRLPKRGITSRSRDFTTSTATETRFLWLRMNCTSGHHLTWLRDPRVLPKSGQLHGLVSTA